jgi:tetratricopeptide (TPR) repeat protein
MQLLLTLTQQGLHAFERKDYAAALELFRTVLRERPGFADIRHHAGLCLGFLGDPDAAIREIDLALEVNPAYVEAHVSRALLLQETGRYDEARQAFQSACHFETAAQGRFAAAVMARLANTHAELGDLYLAAGAPEDAARQYAAALDLRPGYHDIRNKYAVARLDLGQHDDAAHELRVVLEANPRFLVARLNLGLVYYRQGRIADAAAEWQACGVQQPDNPQVRAYIALLEKQTIDDTAG